MLFESEITYVELEHFFLRPQGTYSSKVPGVLKVHLDVEPTSSPVIVSNDLFDLCWTVVNVCKRFTR